MFFYVDESGHTGANLFDEAQPMLYYGVLSSKVNVDILAKDWIAKLRRNLGVHRLHAAELGNGRLASIAFDLAQIQKRLDFRFDIYGVAKPDHAIISFFDQVFDQGMNPAMSWTGYWTPMRYVLLLKLASLFDEELAKRAWQARITVDDTAAQAGMIAVCRDLRDRVGALQDARSRQLIWDALTWAENNPAAISYNVADKDGILQITPNIIGFQSVMHGIAGRIATNRRSASKIVVDQQSQFNKSQRTLADFYASVRGVPMHTGPGMPTASFKNMPTVPIEFSSGTSSAGLELVDIHLWVFKRLFEKKELARELHSIVRPQMYRGIADEISLKGIANRWEKYFAQIPELDEMSDKQKAFAKDFLDGQEARRVKAMRGDAEFDS